MLYFMISLIGILKHCMNRFLQEQFTKRVPDTDILLHLCD